MCLRACAGVTALSKAQLQETLLELMNDDRFVDMLHVQYMARVRAKARRASASAAGTNTAGATTTSAATPSTTASGLTSSGSATGGRNISTVADIQSSMAQLLINAGSGSAPQHNSQQQNNAVT